MRWLLCSAFLLTGCHYDTTVVTVSIPDSTGAPRPAAEQILVVVPYDRAIIKHSPKASGQHVMTPDLERDLAVHYALEDA